MSDEQKQDEQKLAAEGGLLEAYYEEAMKVAEEVGVADQATILAIADEVMGTKVAHSAMVDEIERIQNQRTAAEHYDPALVKAASYAPVVRGPYAGIIRALQNKQEQ